MKKRDLSNMQTNKQTGYLILLWLGLADSAFMDVPAKCIDVSSGDGDHPVVMRFCVVGEIQQAGARLELPKYRSGWAFERWATTPELPAPPKEWLMDQIPPWLKDRARAELGADFREHIGAVTRRALILGRDPVFESGTDLDRYAEKSAARKSHRQLCWAMRNVALNPVDMRCVEAGTSFKWRHLRLRLVFGQ